jgi:UDP-N-acetylglucosamine--N-acetylmuramyl-(pentapeptide) pyrophosphoryl-undecaprenol N-acetylglucosamine transferase
VKLAITAGGTGGHILPAMAVLDALRAHGGLDLDVRFYGPENRGERAAVEARGIRFEGVPAAGVRGRGPLRLAVSIARLGWGTGVALRKLARFRPAAVFSTGGYASFPCSVAARLLRRPLVVYLPDVTPGWAVRAEQRLATRLATTTEAALGHLPAKKTRVTGYPVRATFFEVDRAEARRRLGIGESERVVLVAGASQGARAINAAVFASLAGLLDGARVIHVTGAQDFAEAMAARKALPADLQRCYEPAEYRDDLPLAMLAADVGVMRAGASVLGELPAAALPAVLIPGTFAGGHQRANAQWLASHGAAVVLEERALDRLGATVADLLADPARLATMRAAAAALARPNAADAIGDLILEVARR